MKSCRGTGAFSWKQDSQAKICNGNDFSSLWDFCIQPGELKKPEGSSVGPAEVLEVHCEVSSILEGV